MNDKTTSEALAPGQARLTAVDAPSNLPKLGEWYWVKYVPHGKKKSTKALACVTHVASNHIVFEWNDAGGGTGGIRMPFGLLMTDVTPELKWRDIITQRIADKQKELQDAVRSLADTCKDAELIDNHQQANPSLLPTIQRRDPKEHKQKLLRLKKTALPKAKKTIDQITKEMVALHKDLYQPEQALADKLIKSTEKIDERLFALEIYAGLWEGIKQIRDGEPAPEETPITVRQMLLFMDEECLIDYDKGGMDFRSLSDFDTWVAKDDNRNRIIPEPRCLVALRVRRDRKDYGPINSIAEAFAQIEKDKANMETYLLMRNGDKLYRLGTEIKFEPRLLPLREEFNKPFEEVDSHYNWNTHQTEYSSENITPDHLDYDKHVEQRAKVTSHYNRVLFLIQGLLDRSEVFRPHPPINLMDPADAEHWFRPKHDEEDGLPSANPPSWQEYRDIHNRQIKVGSTIYATWTERPYAKSRNWRLSARDYEYRTHGIHKVTQIRRDRTAVKISWPVGTRWGYEHRGSDGRYWGKYGEWPTDRQHHQWIRMEDAFNFSVYKLGDYKRFLCDPYLKGAYLEWAPQLLGAEKWHQEQLNPNWNSPKASPRKKRVSC